MIHEFGEGSDSLFLPVTFWEEGRKTQVLRLGKILSGNLQNHPFFGFVACELFPKTAKLVWTNIPFPNVETDYR